MNPVILWLAVLIGIPIYFLDWGAAIVGIIAGMTSLFLGVPLAVYGYNKRRYLDHITYSTHKLEKQDDGSTKLLIRGDEILPRSDLLPSNWVLNLKLLFAIWRCKCEFPFLLLKKKDMDIIQPPIINGFSKQFSDGFLADIARLETVRFEYLIAITFEKYGDSASYKISVLIVTGSDLNKFLDPEFCKTVCFERDYHKDRLETLRHMAAQRRKELATTSVDDVRILRLVEGRFRV